MDTITFEFEEISITIGNESVTGKRQNIALITGSAEISYHRTHSDDQGLGVEFSIDAVTLEGPCIGDPKVLIDHKSPLWDYVVESIEHSCSYKINEEIREDMMPDGDAMYEARRERRFE